MRLYSILRYFRLKKLLIIIIIITFLIFSVKMNNYYHFKSTLNYNLLQTHLKNNKFLIIHTLNNNNNFKIGNFLKNKSFGNTSYCDFKYGDASNFNYTDEDVNMTPELGDKAPYRILYNVVEGVNFNSSNFVTITYVTHITIEYLLHLVEVLVRWEGYLSVAAFLPGTDTFVALEHLKTLCYCLEEMSNVSVHFIYHIDHPPAFEDSSNITSLQYLTNKTNVTDDSNTSSYVVLPNDKSCFINSSLLNKNVYRMVHKLVYPVNVARNAARISSRTKYILVSDIELLPSEHLVSEFLKMIEKIKDRSSKNGDHYFMKKRHVYVVPVFEVAEDVDNIPKTRSELLDLYAKDKAVYFHRFVCLHCQRFPGLQRWIQPKTNPRTRPGTIQPLLVVRREFPYHRWEPVYIGTNEDPLYSELLTWEGQQDKMTQMHEMCLLDYRFVILNGAFLVHTPGIKRKASKVNLSKKINVSSANKTSYTTPSPNILSWRSHHMKRNAYLYQLITQDMVDQYRSNPRCKLH